MQKLETQWTVDPERVWQEYPRPQLRRKSYINLNGTWHFAVTSSENEPSEYKNTILVPFSPESHLSGANVTLGRGEYLWYTRSFEAPDLAGGRLMLNFGAVDQSCRVFVNGIKAGEHVGGYLPFSLDITDCVADGANQLTVLVKDELYHFGFARGKQYEKSSGIWYSPVSGIWQTVWMEVVPEVYITSVVATPLFDEGAVKIKICSNKSFKNGRVGILCEKKLIEADELDENGEVVLEIENPREWTPEDPFLYELLVVADDDRVKSYFGMRKWSIEKDVDNIPRVMLNNKPFFFNGLLDQGYWSDGIYTPPTDDALAYDIITAKELGFNTLRKHAKIELARWYYHCDRLGMVVWQDMVNGGGKYKPYTIYVQNRVGNMKDGKEQRAALSREDAFGRLSFIEDTRSTVEWLRSFVSIAMWVPFNEGWGQFDSKSAAEFVRDIDPTRLIDAASGWFDQGAGDVASLHVYFKKFTMPRVGERPVLLTEFGGYSCPVGGHVAADRTFGYKTFSNMLSLTESYSKLYCSEIIPAIKRGLCGCIYTQISDVEQEVNGLMTYDRKMLKLDANVVKSINSRLIIQ